jgi:hypothetical protein
MPPPGAPDAGPPPAEDVGAPPPAAGGTDADAIAEALLAKIGPVIQQAVMSVLEQLVEPEGGAPPGEGGPPPGAEAEGPPPGEEEAPPAEGEEPEKYAAGMAGCGSTSLPKGVGNKDEKAGMAKMKGKYMAADNVPAGGPPKVGGTARHSASTGNVVRYEAFQKLENENGELRVRVAALEAKDRRTIRYGVLAELQQGPDALDFSADEELAETEAMDDEAFGKHVEKMRVRYRRSNLQRPWIQTQKAVGSSANGSPLDDDTKARVVRYAVEKGLGFMAARKEMGV